MESPSIADLPPLLAEQPVLPPSPRVGGPRRLLWSMVAILLIALLVYSWIDVQGSISSLVNGLFNKEGLFRSVLPSAVPPAGDQFWPGIKAAATTFAIAVLSICFGLIFSLAMLPLAARNISPVAPPTSWRASSRRSCVRSPS